MPAFSPMARQVRPVPAHGSWQHCSRHPPHESLFCSRFAGSGKSYSMMGPQDDKGIIPRLCESLFAVIEEVRRLPD
jgi:hypothetical protein